MISSFGSVLLVERDEPGARVIAKALICSRFAVKVSEDPEAALSLIGAYHFDAIILDFSTCCNEVGELRRWIGDSYAAARVALLGESMSAAVQSEVLALGVRLIARTPPNIKALVSFVSASVQKKSRSESFTGKAEQVDLLSYVQFLVLDRKKTVLEVSSFEGSRGEIFIDGGEILHARLGDAQGEGALFQCLALKGGSFAHKPWHPPESATISRPADSLLFEAARIRDESKPDP